MQIEQNSFFSALVLGKVAPCRQKERVQIVFARASKKLSSLEKRNFLSCHHLIEKLIIATPRVEKFEPEVDEALSSFYLNSYTLSTWALTNERLYDKISVQSASIAQMVEHRPSKPSVAGSNPVARSKTGIVDARFFKIGGWNLSIVKAIFVILASLSYIYMGVRILKMRVRFAAFIYLVLLAIFILSVVSNNDIFILVWSVFSLLLSSLIFIMAR